MVLDGGRQDNTSSVMALERSGKSLASTIGSLSLDLQRWEERERSAGHAVFSQTSGRHVLCCPVLFISPVSVE